MIIGFVNNMPDGALRATERQFTELIELASSHFAEPVAVRWFAIPEVSRGPAGLAHIRRHYEDVSRLWRESIDGLIVSGAEPKALSLEEEPYWPTFSKLIEWAATHTYSALWSCLAVHAAVFALDGIRRCGLSEKLSGVIPCEKAIEHPLVAGLSPCWAFPHSRFNGVPEEALVASGYEVLSRVRSGGADLFVKRVPSLFVFMQGHPEYEGGTLMREYQRDIGRYLRGEREAYPSMPSNYFDDAMVTALEEFQRRVLARRNPALLNELPATEARSEPKCSWHETAVRLYENWLSYIHTCQLEARARQRRDLAIPLP